MAKKILIADADKADQEEFRKIFEATDYHLIFTESGEQALLRIKRFEPNLVIAGGSLKEKSGLEVCTAIKADPESKHIPVLLLAEVFKGISEERRKRVRVDGIINVPFHEDEILNLVDRLTQGEVKSGNKEDMLGRRMERKSIDDLDKINTGIKEEFLLDPMGEAEDEEIIELVDVVEEPELKMSIQDFVTPVETASIAEITPLESWEKLMEEEKPVDRRSKFGPNEKEREAKGLSLQLSEEVHLRKEVSENELFDKTELEEILKQVEQLTPSIEKEWPPEERKSIPEEKGKAPKPVAPPIEESGEKYAGLAEFEAALKRGLGTESHGEEVPSLYTEGAKREVTKGGGPAKVPLEQELKKGKEERFEDLEEKESQAIGEAGADRTDILEGLAGPGVEKGEVGAFERPDEERIDILEGLAGPGVEKGEVGAFEKPDEERIDILEGLEGPGAGKDKVGVFEKSDEERIDILEGIRIEGAEREKFAFIEKPEEERIDILETMEILEVGKEEIEFIGEPSEEKDDIFEEVKIFEVESEEIKTFEQPDEEKESIFDGIEVVEVDKEEIKLIGEHEDERIDIFEGIEISEVKKEEVIFFETPEGDKIDIFEGIKAPEVEKEEIGFFEKAEEDKIDIFEGIEISEVEKREILFFEKPEEERIDIFEGITTTEVDSEAIRVIEKPTEERVEVFDEMKAPEVVKEGMTGFEKSKESRLEPFEEVTGTKVIAPEVTRAEIISPIVEREGFIPSSRTVELQMEEVISKGAREMMEGLITKLVPEMTQSIMNFTIQRIERMVKEIVPELAEKIIQEEIQRLQKGEKD